MARWCWRGRVRPEARPAPLVRLDSEHEAVAPARAPPRLSEERVGDLLEDDGDLRDPLGKALPDPQAERNTGPAPVVEADSPRHVRRGERTAGDAGLLAVSRHRTALNRARAVLPRHHIPRHLFRPWVAGRAKNLDLLVPDGIGLEDDGRFHGNERQ